MKIDIREKRLLELVGHALAALPESDREALERQVESITANPADFEGTKNVMGLTFNLQQADGRYDIMLNPVAARRGNNGALFFVAAMHEFAHALLKHPEPGVVDRRGREALEREAQDLADLWILNYSRAVKSAVWQREIDALTARVNSYRSARFARALAPFQKRERVTLALTLTKPADRLTD